MKLSDRTLADKFFVEEGPTSYKCKECGKVLKKTGSSYCNVAVHFRSQHAKIIEEEEQKMKVGQATLQFEAFDQKTRDIFLFAQYIVLEGQPFNCVESAWIRKNTTIQSTVSRHFISNVINELCEVCMLRVKEKLPKRFGIIFDGWSNDGYHYIATFAVFGKGNERVQVLLNFGSLEDSYTAEDHVKHFTDVLEVYDRQTTDILFLVSDNCTTVKRVAVLLKLPLVGCACHRLNLAVNKIYELQENAQVLNKVSECS